MAVAPTDRKTLSTSTIPHIHINDSPYPHQRFPICPAAVAVGSHTGNGLKCLER
jgi:hypothetical protein